MLHAPNKKLISCTNTTFAFSARSAAYKQTGSGFSRGADGHHRLTSSHKKGAERRAAEEEGGCRHTTAGKRHSPSALVVCDALADNAGSVHSVAGGGNLLSYSLFWEALLQSVAPVPVTFSPPFSSSSRFSTKRFFPLQDVARYWFSSVPGAFRGCRTNHMRECNNDDKFSYT